MFALNGWFYNMSTGWWLVEADGEVGWAPALFLEPADEMGEISDVQTFPIGRGSITSYNKDISPVQFCRIYSDAVFILGVGGEVVTDLSMFWAIGVVHHNFKPLETFLTAFRNKSLITNSIQY